MIEKAPDPVSSSCRLSREFLFYFSILLFNILLGEYYSFFSFGDIQRHTYVSRALCYPATHPSCTAAYQVALLVNLGYTESFDWTCNYGA